ncbi:MAG: hypothetical protein JXQ73_05535 [Phycisphaerae bacterium]|nr:hypothetical protein [Phycisphaerae bacterium]
MPHQKIHPIPSHASSNATQNLLTENSTSKRLIKVCLVVLFGAACDSTRANSPESQRWDFEGNLNGWSPPGAPSGIAVDPNNPANHVFKIVAARPHHTKLTLDGSRRSTDFVASCRVRVSSYKGEPPTIYLYARSGQEGFRALAISGPRARAFCWNGQGKPNPRIGQIDLPFKPADRRWMNVKLACFGDHLAAKVWLDGTPEPPSWPMTGSSPGPKTRAFAIGAWTSPRTPSQATVLVDDVTLAPLAKRDLDALGLRFGPRPPLDPAAVKIETGPFESGAVLGLATKTTLVAFDRKTGELAHVVHRPSGREFVASAVYRPLFDLRLTKPYAAKEQQTTSAAFRKIVVRKTGAAGIEATFTDHVSLPITAKVHAKTGQDGTIRLGIDLTNPSDWAVAAIRFPLMAWPARLGDDADDDRLILPWLGGSVLPAPGQLSQSRTMDYPGISFAQFTAFYDNTAGLYLAAHDPNGHCKRWDLATSRDAYVQMPLAHLLPELPARQVSIPYDVVLDTFRGDWRDAAAIYKRWARNQPWCRTPLADRNDVPDFLKKGTGILIAGIQDEAGRTRTVGKDLERLPGWVAQYRKRTELSSITFVPYGWENRGTWAGINYLPAVPSNEAWQRAAAALKAQGDRLAFLTSGFWWVVKRRETSSGPAFDDTADFERRAEMVVHRADGRPFLVDNYDQTTGHGSWRGLSATLCHGSRAAQDTMRDTFLNIARLGVSLISFDQEIGGGQRAPCYDKRHGHPPGHGCWMWTDFRDLCADIIDKGKPIQPDLGLFLENTSELAIPVMSTYWSRQFGEVDHGVTGARGIGLFSYLYHEYVTAIGAACVQGQGAQGTRPHCGLRCRALANNLVRGLIPGPFHHDVPLETNDPWRDPVARAYFSYCKPYARFPEYLLLGQACPPPAVTCETTDVWFYRYDSKGKALRPGQPKVSKIPLVLPAVIAGSFIAADKSVGTVIVNTTDADQQATATLDAPAREAILYRADKTEVRRWNALQPGAKVEMSLEPFATRMLIVPPQRGG